MKLLLSFALLIAAASGACAGPLSRSAQVLQEKNGLTIAFFGGSITSGAGASDKEKTSYRALVTQWFRKKFPGVDIRAIDASLDGTGTWQGSYRVGLHVAEPKPDLVFVEFAVNDDKKDPGDISRSMEGIVRHIRRENARSDIVFLYTAKSEFEAAYEAGQLPPSAAEHEKIAQHYGIPSLNVGAELWKEIKAEGKSWKELLPDSVHPNDAGYIRYANTITKFLVAQDWKDGSNDVANLPAPFNAKPNEYRRMVDAWTIEAPDWKQEKIDGLQRFPHSITAEESGTELVYRFQGTVIGLFLMQSPEAGDFEWSVDGLSPERESTYSSKRSTRVAILKSLPPGEHELRLKLLPDKAPQSAGTVIRIGAIFLNQPPAAN